MKNLSYRIGCALAEFLTCIPNGSKRVIVSRYNNYEHINTYRSLSLRLLKFAYYLQGFTVYSKYNNTADFELYDVNKDQVTYHSPYNNFL